jgi:hypothetical protein
METKMETEKHQKMRSYLRKHAPRLSDPNIPLGSFCKTHGPVPMELSCSQVWRHSTIARRRTRDISSTLPRLTQDFARGWNTLPYELKLRVFSMVTGADPSCKHNRVLGWKDCEILTRRIVQFARCGPEFKMLAEQTLYSAFDFQVKSCCLGVLVPHSPHIRVLHVYLDVYSKPDPMQRLLESLQSNRHGLRLKRLTVTIERQDLDVDEGVVELLKEGFVLCAREGRVCVVKPCNSSYGPLNPRPGKGAKERSRAHLTEVEELARKNITFSPALLDGEKLG